MQVINTSGMSRLEKLQIRGFSLGASDSSVIACLSRKSRFGLWCEKTRRCEPDEAGEEAQWGLDLEPLIARHWENRTCGRIAETQVMVRDPRFEWLTATLDALTDDDQIVEFKAVGIGTAKGIEDGDASTLPPAWILQAHHQMFVAAKPVCNFAVFIGHRLRLYTFEVPWDAELWEPVFALEREFWDHVKSDTPPAEFSGEDCAAIQRYFNRVEPACLEIDDELAEEHARRFVEAKDAKKYAEKAEAEAKAALLFRMGNAERARIGPYEFNRKLVQVKATTPKPRPASSYVRFTCTSNGDDE